MGGQSRPPLRNTAESRAWADRVVRPYRIQQNREHGRTESSAPTGAVVIVSMGGCRHPPLQHECQVSAGGQSRPPLRVQCKSPGECVGALCIIRQSIHLCYSVAAAPIGRAVLYRRRVVRCGEVTVVWWPERSILVLAVMLRQNAPRVSSASFCLLFLPCEDEPPEARKRLMLSYSNR